MKASRRLQLAALTLLWLQLMLLGQLQSGVAVAMPLLIMLGLRQAQPQRGVVPALTAASLLIWAINASLGDRTALLQSSCNLLWLLSGLKLLEARQPAGLQRCSLLLLVAIGLAGLSTQALGPSLVLAAASLLTLASLLSLHSRAQPLAALLGRSMKLVTLALPLLVAAFVLLPRLEPLWSLTPSNQARTGLSSRLAPGELASLVQDDGLAARLSIAPNLLPPPEQRYWRVLVHQHFDGTSWSQADKATALPRERASATPAAGQENWMVEPHGLTQRPWSGRGKPLTPALTTTSTGTLIGRSALQQRDLYKLDALNSRPEWQQIPPSALDLELPPAANPRLKALGNSWKRQSANPSERVLLARHWYLKQGFRYTLEPGALGSINPLDGFLFETRAGFCEHFAASFSALMRAAGVPARVVVGYQGGSWQQPMAGQGHLELRNSDAHAWSEVWLNGRGWVRVDPTAWVAPERVRRSLAASLSQADRARLGQQPPSWLKNLTSQWRGLDYRWQLWVMGFDRQTQRSLIGEGPWQGLVALAAMAMGLALGVLPLLRERRGGDVMQRQLHRLLRHLARDGLSLQPGETLPQFSQRAGCSRPELRIPLAEVCQLYEQMRFDPRPPSPELRAMLRQAIDRCRRSGRA